MTDGLFWNKVDKTGDCWLWTGTKVDGYGLVRRRKIQQQTMYVHRYSWMLHNGPIPEGLMVLHRCDNRACVRPDHLWVGTCADNLRDMALKDRSTRKVTSEQVREMRRRWRAGERQIPLAAEFGVSQTTVSRIVRGESGRHVKE